MYTSDVSGAAAGSNLGSVLILIILGVIVGGILLFLLPIIICNKIAKYKNLPTAHKWIGFLGVLGIVVMVLVKARYVTCKNCGYEYHPERSNVCPICGETFLRARKVSEPLENKDFINK